MARQLTTVFCAICFNQLVASACVPGGAGDQGELRIFGLLDDAHIGVAHHDLLTDRKMIDILFCIQDDLVARL